MAKPHHKPTASPPAERRLTVAAAAYPPRRDPGDPATHRPARPVPWIRLRGLWLRQAGFHPHSRLRVRVAHRCLVITLD